LIVALVATIFIADVVGNFGKIHSGVTMQGIDVGGLTREEAAARIDQELGAVTSNGSVALFANEQAAAAGINDSTVEVAPEGAEYDQSVENAESTSWLISSTTVGAFFDAQALAEKAYAVGRDADFFPGRFKASFGGGVALEAALDYEQVRLEGIKTLLTKAIGQDMVNAGVHYSEEAFVATEGSEGLAVDHNAFVALLNKAFFGTQRTVVVPMATVYPEITYDEAVNMAALVQERTAHNVDLVYEGSGSWTVDSQSLGLWVVVSTEGSGEEAKLVPWVDVEKLEEGMQWIIGDQDPGIKPQNARFELVGDKIEIVPGEKGTGIDYKKVSTDLYGILFSPEGASKERKINLSVSDLEPEFTTAMAQEMNIKDKLASYTTEYTIASDNKVTNIHLASDLLNYSLIEPGGVWSFHDTAGECNAERGFKQATSIVEGEYVDEIGGGICQVATTVFNAAFESGLPIMERANHAFYLIAYPAGRDAAVSWRWLDLKFQNDTNGHVLMTMSYTNTSLTCTLWGTDPGYRVEVEDTGFTDRTDFKSKEVVNPELKDGEKRVKQEGVRGRTIVVTRYVYDRDGALLRQTAFKSIYEPETEIVEVKKKSTDKSDSDGAAKADGSGEDAKNAEGTASNGSNDAKKPAA
jgi:vancomycin resistance protein YoaR